MPIPSSRRTLLQFGGAAALSTLPFIRAGAVEGETPPVWRYFTADESAFVTAACDRLIPPDPPGPGAVEVGCVNFIDNQLAGPYGAGARLYLQGPFHPGQSQQGYQLGHTPAELYRLAVPRIDDVVRARHGADGFAALKPSAQDELLHSLNERNGSFSDWGADFADMLLRNTIEGYFADPIYGGNRDMATWRMIGFPGAYAQYVELVDAHDRPFSRPPMSIAQAASPHPHRH